jgi:putative acetyltransferase
MEVRAPLTIRPEQPGDRAAVFDINRRAFPTAAEADLVELVRPATPLISLVAVAPDTVVGHILFTPVRVVSPSGSSDHMALGPMAVLPEHQRKGVGSALVRAGLQYCIDIGHFVVFVLGHPDYYGRFGFRPAPPLDLHFKGPEFDPYFMVAELAPGKLAGLSGMVRYLPPFEEF